MSWRMSAAVFGRPATARSRFPAPIGSEPSTVPADHRLRLENFQGVQYSRSQTIEPSKHQAVNVAEGQSLGGFSPQHVELVSKDKDLGFQRSPRPGTVRARRTRSTCKDRSSGASISRFAVAVSLFGFAVGTAAQLARDALLDQSRTVSAPYG